MYELAGKRLFDLLCASIGLIVTSPIVGIAALLVWLGDRSSPLFRQIRVGRYGEPFEILKLRTMAVDTEQVASADAATLQVTRVGAALRRTNIDELPQLVNVLRGEMSLIGPRPALPSQEALVTMRHEQGAYRVRPGLTGLAQVRAYDDMPEFEKAQLDGAYSASVTFRDDLQIVLHTFKYFLKPPPRY